MLWQGVTPLDSRPTSQMRLLLFPALLTGLPQRLVELGCFWVGNIKQTFLTPKW